tara:strand:- start:69 stop:398 length:330 start_codon:yes stop_codon:yes gene_type:complete
MRLFFRVVSKQLEISGVVSLNPLFISGGKVTVPMTMPRPINMRQWSADAQYLKYSMDVFIDLLKSQDVIHKGLRSTKGVTMARNYMRRSLRGVCQRIDKVTHGVCAKVC